MRLLMSLISVFTFLAIVPSSAQAQRVLTGSEASKVLKFENLSVTPDKISITIVNVSPHIVRDAQLLIQYHWLWDNEGSPGLDSLGRAFAVNLGKGLKPGESTPFSYTPWPPLPNRADGRFMLEVDVAGFTVVIPQQTAAARF